jgi:hypothetical protein
VPAERKVVQAPLPQQVAAEAEEPRQGAPLLDSSEEQRRWPGAELRAWPEQRRPEDARRLGRQVALQRSREPAVEARSQSEAPDAAEASRCGAEPEPRPWARPACSPMRPEARQGWPRLEPEVRLVWPLPAAQPGDAARGALPLPYAAESP